MKTNKTILLAIFSALMLFACSKEQLTGPQGPQGPPGIQGPQGPAGSSNILGAYQVEPQINWFTEQSNGVWQYQTTTADVPAVNLSNNTVIGFMAGQVTSSPQWVAMPYNHYWSGGTAYVKHYYAVAPNGRIWLYMRRNNGDIPYGNQNSNTPLGYRFYILKSGQVPDDLDVSSLDAVEDFIARNPDALVSFEALDVR